jgi:hypothetical protein
MTCEHCQETGYLFVKIDEVKEPVLMVCRCEFGKNVLGLFEHIPMWSYQKAEEYEQQPFPKKTFNPDFGNSMCLVSERWNARKKFSNEFWKYQKEKGIKDEPA